MSYGSAVGFAGAEPNNLEPLGLSKSRNDEPEAVILQEGRHQPSLSEYHYYATLKRRAERDGISLNGVDENGVILAGHSPWAFFKTQKAKKKAADEAQRQREVNYEKSAGEKEKGVIADTTTVQGNEQFVGLNEEEADRLSKHRQLRVASWAMMFYLITTDILGPFNAPYAIASLGLVPGIICYFFFGIIVSATAYIIGHLFLKLDSDRFPIRTFGDLGNRTIGPWFRHLCSILQTIQLIVNVGLICLSKGQALWQSAHHKLCFSVAVFVMTIAGMLVGQIRSLRNFAFFGSSAVYINLFILTLSTVVVAHSPPNYAVANRANDTVGYGPVVVKAFNSANLEGQVNGIFNLVFAYGGAMIFPEMISEMRRPGDFWKGMITADTLIMLCYMFYGVFWYCFQGQYTQPNAFQGLAPYWAQTTCNVCSMISGLIAACLYGNIGIKVIYINVVQEIFKGPQLNTKKGRLIWTIMVPVYWALAFVIANSIPALGAMTGLIGVACIFQFSYVFPPIMLLVHNMRVHAAQGDQLYSGYGTQHVQKDSWKTAARWKRAIFGVGPDVAEPGILDLPNWAIKLSKNKSWQLFFKIFLVGFILACFACTGLGLWGTGLSIKETFEVGQGTAFGCRGNA